MDTSTLYRNRFLQNQIRYEKKFKSIFDNVAEQFSLLSNDPSIKFTKAYQFPKNIDKKMTVIMAEFHDRTLSLTEKEIENAWNLSNEKNDTLIENYLKTIAKIKAVQSAAYFNPNTSALKAFLSTDHGAGTLSDSVWNIARSYRMELEAHLSIGLANGDSAGVISRRIRRYLNNPDALFRRVRNDKGKLIASRAMSEYHPGQGVYKSAYKNAMRVARSNTNQAFLLADHLRWQKMEMVVGVKISLSSQHKVPDICDDLWGDYPKDFVFTGWHPQCLCHATPILTPEPDFIKYLQTGIKPKARQIQEMPAQFTKYVQNNYERYAAYKSVPYWIQDNQKIVKQALKGIKVMI